MPQEPPETAAALTKLADATDVAAAIDEFSPPHPGYRALKAKLAELRGSDRRRSRRSCAFRTAPTLRPGMEDARVPLLRQRLNVAGDETDLRYDEALVDAVKAFQKANRHERRRHDRRRHRAQPQCACRRPRRTDVIDTIIANMERWRWMPRDLGNAHVMLNIPNYTLRVMHDGKQVWTDARRRRQADDGDAAADRDDEVHHRQPDLERAAVDRAATNICRRWRRTRPCWRAWASRSSTTATARVHIYQPPGDNNALGRIRFNFPNRVPGLSARHAGQAPVRA